MGLAILHPIYISKISTDLLMANQIYVNDKVLLKKKFRKVSLKKFSCGVESLNFDNKKKTAQIINDFIEDKTHGKIQNIIQPESINSDTAAMIINAVYFKSNWKIKFNKNLTTEGDFYINDNETAEQEIKLNDILKRLGMVEMFDQNKANFPGISGTMQQLYVDSVIHKTLIDVTEDGLEEAAASLVRIHVRCDPPIILPIEKFHVDHPFLYYIWDRETKTVVFTGRITKFN
ncbi:serine protease inhibitor 42Dd-like [Sitodiplosis mosellana]|uniref:serine protease inhibitor 42Dd-like n=1 Tax=Sitodiplosis mosellana TaxID=263140 RepID=UPI0024447EE1|nr:serine protease inhibitor 42Dd-like [Sitodiplosis mosellana]